MYSFDCSGSGTQKPVAWPAQQTPLSHFLFSSREAWCVSFDKNLIDTAIHVTLQNRKTGKTWRFSAENADGDFYVNNGGYGLVGCVIFRPSGIGTINAGDSYLV